MHCKHKHLKKTAIFFKLTKRSKEKEIKNNFLILEVSPQIDLDYDL